MPATLVVNHLSVVHKGSGGTSMIFPDVCKTPSPAGPVPIPYPNTALSSDTADGSSTVKVDGNPIMLKSSNFAMSTGDEAGSAMGVMSNKIKGKAYPKLYSFDVKADGENVFRLTDIMLQNGGSPTNTPPGTEVQANTAASGLSDKDPEIPEVTRIAWSKDEAVCGDQVDLSVKTAKVSGALDLPMVFKRKEPKGRVEAIPVPVSSNSGRLTWVSRRGQYFEKVELLATQSTLKGKRESNKALLLKVPGPATFNLPSAQRLFKNYKRNTAGAKPAFIPASPTTFYFVYGYHLELKRGELLITRKLDFDRKPGVKAGPKQYRAWKREILAVWDRRFKLHRTKCKRGPRCNCSPSHGCCAWLIRVKCEFAGGHSPKVVLNAGKNDPKGNTNGTQNWWYSNKWWEGLAGVAGTVRPHEFGHLIGLVDEYAGGANDPLGQNVDSKNSVMGWGSYAQRRHFKAFQDWFHSKASVVGKTIISER